MAKKKTETVIRQFKDGRNLFWVEHRVYSVEGTVVTFVAGGIEDPEDIIKLKTFLKIN